MLELLTVDYRDPEAGRLLSASLHHTGFAVLKNHPITASLVDAVYSEWQGFFASESKHDYLFHKDIQEGYFPFQSENAKYTSVKDLKEFYHFHPWGRLPHGLSGQTLALFHAMNALAGEVLDGIERHTPQEIAQGFSVPLSQMIQGSKRTLMRILHYPALTGSEAAGAVRAAPHEDIGFLTLLPAATAKGLQVQDGHGQWHEVPCDYGTIVINTCDTLAAVSQGYYRATFHQVVNPEGELARQPRLSMPLFLHPRDEVLLPDGRQAVDYLMQRLTELGLT